jgi:hypothetical protein
MMNLKLNDGTVRCLSCMDASSYACETDEACTYCGQTPVTEEVAQLSPAPKAPTCDGCGSSEDVRSFQLYYPNGEDDGYAPTCRDCRLACEA